MFTSGILLAAGSSTRMGVDKLQLPYKGRLLIDCALAPLVECRLIDEVIVVVRPDSSLLTDGPKCRIVVNPDHREGMGTSLRTGVQAASPAADAFVVSLADMPDLTAEIVTTLIEAFYRGGKQILVPVCDARNGHPVVFAAACRGDLLRLTGDLGARSLIAAHPELVTYLPVPHPAVIHDLDTPADIA